MHLIKTKFDIEILKTKLSEQNCVAEYWGYFNGDFMYSTEVVINGCEEISIFKIPEKFVTSKMKDKEDVEALKIVAYFIGFEK